MVKVNHSKSSISTYSFCEYAFYKQKILNEYGALPLVATHGIEMHRYFEMFFNTPSGGGIDFEILWELDEDRYFGTDKNEVFCYFMNKLYSYIDDKYKDDTKFYRNLKSFSVWNATRWRETKYHFKSKEKCRRYFMPRAIEERFILKHESTPRTLKGYVDVRFVAPKIKGKERVRLSDYKTGRVPKGVRREVNEGGTYYSKELASKFVFEGNFYCMMYLLKQKYIIKKENDRYYVFDKTGKSKIKIGWLEYEYIFTNASKVYIARKKCHIKSIRSAINKMQKIDKHISDYEMGLRTFERDPSQYKCPKCNYFITDCVKNIDPLEAEIIKSLMIPEEIEINEDFYIID